MNVGEKALWIAKRTALLDARLLQTRKPALRRRLSLLLAKYELLARHSLRPFRLGTDHVRLNGKNFYYGTRYGVFDYERMLVTYGAWLNAASLPDDCNVIDIGANVGFFARFVRDLYPRSRLFCFEPIPQTFECLKKNFGDDSRIELFNLAVSDRAGSDRMEFDPGKSLFSTISQIGNTEIQKATLDEVLAGRSDPIDLMKIDTEGHEDYVLEGATNALARTRYLMMEVQMVPEPRYTISSLLRRLSADQYDFQLVRYRNFLDKSEGEIPVMDMFMRNVRFANVANGNERTNNASRTSACSPRL